MISKIGRIVLSDWESSYIIPELHDTHNTSSHDTKKSAKVRKVDPGTRRHYEIIVKIATGLGKVPFRAENPYITQQIKFSNNSCHKGTE